MNLAAIGKGIFLILQIIPKAVKAYDSFKKRRKKGRLSDEIKKKNDRTTVDELRDLGL